MSNHENQSGSSALREAMGHVETAVSAALAHAESNESKVAIHEVAASVSRLGHLLALGAEPELRDCPTCGRQAMRAATLCGYCWSHLEPLAPLADAYG